MSASPSSPPPSAARPGGRRSSSVRLALGQLVAAVLLPLMLAGAAMLVGQWNGEREAALARLQGEAQALQVAVDRELALDLAVLQTLASAPAVEEQDWAALHAAATRAAAIRPASVITVFGPDGQNLLNSSQPYGTPLPNAFMRPAEKAAAWQGRDVPLPTLEFFAEPFRTGRPAFSGLVWGRLSRRPVVATHVPVLREGTPVLVVGMAYGADTYGRLLAATDAPKGLLRAVVDGRGTVVARQPNHDGFVARRAPHVFADGGAALPARGTGRGRSLDGDEVYFAHSRSAINDWTVVIAMPRDAVLSGAWAALWTSLAGLLAAAGLGAVLAMRLAHRLAGPLHALAARASAPGAPPPPLARSGLAELDTLARALDDAAQAQQQRARLEREREQAREDLRRANDELTLANRQKDEFIGMLSHELRNPLAPIRNSLFILDRVDPAGPVGLRARQTIERQVTHMTALVDDLLDITRMARGRLELKPVPIDLGEFVARIAQDQHDLLAARGLQIDLQPPAAPVHLRADPTRLAQVIGNLVHNAAKFTPSGGRVALRAALDGDEAVIEVADTGAGIAPAQLARIFEPFVQGEQGLARTAGGLGLGLAIVRGVVALHGGRVEAFSDGPGHGSRFVVRLPAQHGPAGAAAPEERRHGPREPGRRRRVLVVEDHPDVAQSLAEMVRLLGHEVEWAADAPAALALHARQRPDTVICDIGLPGTDGYALAGALRAAGSRARLIALTGYARPEDVSRALASGFDAHVAKPADPLRIVSLLGRADGAA